jgi:hypothetical protein
MKIASIHDPIPLGTVIGEHVGRPPSSEAEHYFNAHYAAAISMRATGFGLTNIKSRCRARHKIGSSSSAQTARRSGERSCE